MAAGPGAGAVLKVGPQPIGQRVAASGEVAPGEVAVVARGMAARDTAVCGHLAEAAGGPDREVWLTTPGSPVARGGPAVGAEAADGDCVGDPPLMEEFVDDRRACHDFTHLKLTVDVIPDTGEPHRPGLRGCLRRFEVWRGVPRRAVFAAGFDAGGFCTAGA